MFTKHPLIVGANNVRPRLAVKSGRRTQNGFARKQNTSSTLQQDNPSHHEECALSIPCLQ